MPDSMEDYLAGLTSPQAAALRESTCGALAEALAATGAVLWAFGFADQPRRAIAAAIQMGGETARGPFYSCATTTDMLGLRSFAR